MKKLWATFVVFSCCLPLATGCIVEEQPRRTGGYVPTANEGGEDGAGGDVDDVEEGECDDGEIRDCKVQINENNCFVGEQICELGFWSDCLEPSDIDNG